MQSRRLRKNGRAKADFTRLKIPSVPHSPLTFVRDNCRCREHRDSGRANQKRQTWETGKNA